MELILNATNNIGVVKGLQLLMLLTLGPVALALTIALSAAYRGL